MTFYAVTPFHIIHLIFCPKRTQVLRYILNQNKNIFPYAVPLTGSVRWELPINVNGDHLFNLWPSPFQTWSPPHHCNHADGKRGKMGPLESLVFLGGKTRIFGHSTLRVLQCIQASSNLSLRYSEWGEGKGGLSKNLNLYCDFEIATTKLLFLG